jgi:hypothetical protein
MLEDWPYQPPEVIEPELEAVRRWLEETKPGAGPIQDAPLPDTERRARRMSADGGLYVVRIEDSLSAALAGHEGRAYVSPPQPRDQALALVALLGGCDAALQPDRGTWTQPVAGGRRTIELTPATAR